MQRIPWLVTGALVLSLASGCGMAVHGMCGMQGMHGGSSHSSGPPATRVIGEVRTETLVLSLDVPPLRVGHEETLTAAAVDAATGQPATDLTVTFDIGRVLAHAPAHGSGHGGDAEPAAVRKPGTVLGSGRYALRHTFVEPGTFAIAATAAEGEGLPALTVRVTQEVRDSQGDHGESPQGLRPLAVLGAVAMAAMMALKFAWL